MSTTVGFDTHEIFRRLKQRGFTEEQAHELVEAMKDAQNELATKSDIRELEHRLKIWFGGLMAGAVVLIAALHKLI
ncbi:MAG: DUF1640 domain-containing protein [Acidobacteria bacterium]|nr:MAG: DUF1640 domain-containing protein [Acidobacteriota bacterium]